MMGQVVYLGLCLLGCLLLNTSVEGAGNDTVAARSTCPDGALNFRRKCYEFFPEEITWSAAETECQQLRSGGHLASFSSLIEEKVVSTYIRRFGSNIRDAWIGLYAIPTSNQLAWEWSDDSRYVSGSALWDNWTPSTSLSSSKCVALSSIQYPSFSFRWSQRDCENSYPYVCKYKAQN